MVSLGRLLLHGLVLHAAVDPQHLISTSVVTPAKRNQTTVFVFSVWKTWQNFTRSIISVFHYTNFEVRIIKELCARVTSVCLFVRAPDQILGMLIFENAQVNHGYSGVGGHNVNWDLASSLSQGPVIRGFPQFLQANTVQNFR
jgi:hypothetical protein